MSDSPEPVVVRLERKSKNAIDPTLVAWLGDQLDRAGGRPVLLCGTRDAFCAGLDLRCVAGLGGAELEAFLGDIDRLFARVAAYPGPTVALVEGHAIAGGAVLARACDHAVVLDEPRLKIGVNEVALGVPFPPRTRRVLLQKLPRRHVHRVLLGAELHGPRAAVHLGLLDEFSEEPEALARARLAQFARHPQEAFALTKRALAGALEPDAADEARLADELAVWRSDGVRARILAVLGR